MHGRARLSLLLRLALALSACIAFAAVAFVAVTFVPAPARADVPGDVAVAAPESALPAAPDDYLREEHGAVLWDFPAQAKSVVRELQKTYREEWPRVVRELGMEVDDALVIRIGRNPDEMAALAPVGHPPPGYASGVAYLTRGLILLTLSAPETWQRPDVESVLVHELSHIALHRAVNGNPTPRWFSEGVAIHQAGEHNLDRIKTLWSGTVSGELVPMSDLSGAFPHQPHAVNLAYAQSADFVRWLLARDDGEDRFRELVDRLGRGQPFPTALERTYSIRMQILEIEWHEDLAERFQAWPLLFGTGVFWVFAAGLLVIAYVRRKRRNRATLREWEALEAVEDEPETLGPDTPEPAPILAAFDRASEDDDRLYIVPPEPRIRDSSIPTVEHEGRSHTLH